MMNPNSQINPIAMKLAMIYAEEKLSQYLKNPPEDTTNEAEIDLLQRAYTEAYQRIDSTWSGR